MTQRFKMKMLLSLMSLLLLGGGQLLSGQVSAGATSGGGLGGFVSFGGLRTHVINYTYNALGVDGGIFLQRSPLFGIEVRAASYPMFARYSQTPLTAGYRVELDGRRPRNLLFSGYVGGGMSWSQDATSHYVPIPAQWYPTWQVSQATTINMGMFSWKPYEATFTQTYTSQRTLTGFALTTGVVYTFPRAGMER